MPYYFHIHKEFDRDPGAMTDWIARFEKFLGEAVKSPGYDSSPPGREPPYGATPSGRININWDPGADIEGEELDFELYLQPGKRYEISEDQQTQAESIYSTLKGIGNPDVDLTLTTRTKKVAPLPQEQVDLLVTKIMEENGLTREQAEDVFADLTKEREIAYEDPSVWSRKAEGTPKPVRGRRLTYRHTPENQALGLAGKEKYPEGRPWEQTELWKANIDSIYTSAESVDPNEWRRMYRSWRNKTPAQRLAQKIYNESSKGVIQHETYDQSDKANIGYWDEEAGVFKIGARKKYRTGPKGKKAVARAQVNQRLRTTRSRQLAREGMGGLQIEITLWKEGLYPGFKTLERFIIKKLNAAETIDPKTGEEYTSEEGADFGEGYPVEDYEGDEI